MFCMHKKHLTFNIIYIPGTVDYQAIALLSMLLNSDLNFKLIGNGLEDKEAGLLEEICSTSERLTCINFKSKNIIPHGTLVDLMFLSESDNLFCFCDSDIFLFEKLTASHLLEQISGYQVFSSGGRIENEDQSVYAGFKGGATTVSQDGKIALATSFFCVYERAVLQQSLDLFHVGFEQYRIEEQIPVGVRQIIKDLGLSYEMFDTGKLLSVLLHKIAAKKNFTELPGLVHIGGMSGRYLQQLDQQQGVVLDDLDLGEPISNQNNQFNVRNDYEKALKKLYGKYFYCYLNHLLGRGLKPQILTKNTRILNTIKRLEQNIEKAVVLAQKNQTTEKIWQLIKHENAQL